jgi:hypothetical protein
LAGAGFDRTGGSGVSLATAGVPMISLVLAAPPPLLCFSRASSSFVAVGSGGVGRALGLSPPPPQAARSSAVTATVLNKILGVVRMQRRSSVGSQPGFMQQGSP